jgi:hypothetical protein
MDTSEGTISFEKILIPGGNNIPLEVVEALESFDKTKGPGKVWAQWQELGWVEVDVTEGATERPEGPQAPKTLERYRLDQVKFLLETETDIIAMQRWAKADKRKPVRDAVRQKLVSLGY